VSEASDEASLRHLRFVAKRELRKRMRDLRRLLPQSACEKRTAAATARLIELPELLHARTILGFCAIHKELDPAGVLAWAERKGKRIALPRVEGERLDIHLHHQGAPLDEGAFGTLEPLSSAPRIEASEVDVVLVPGLAFDGQGQRIGYGQAFYDRLLPSMPQAFRIGIAYDFQLLAELPAEAHDVPMHCVISDARTLRVQVESPGDAT
jgi:5-formyltetrahydrofolate cyclo-ligase